MKFDNLCESILNEQVNNTLFMIHRSLDEFFENNKKEFTNKMAALKTLKIIDEEESDVKIINHVAKFFGYLKEPEKHEEFIDATLDFL